ncbi:MAG: hypothetical protein QM296_05715 [Bacillota bacterium]|nr:hypothetical protein [Bacillota bacterium]
MKMIDNHRSLKNRELVSSGLIDGHLIADRPDAATVKESLTVQHEGGHRADAEEIAELARIEEQLELKKETR